MSTLDFTTSSIKGNVRLSFQYNVVYQITDLTDNTAWWSIDITYTTSSPVSHYGMMMKNTSQFLPNGDKGEKGKRRFRTPRSTGFQFTGSQGYTGFKGCKTGLPVPRIYWSTRIHWISGFYRFLVFGFKLLDSGFRDFRDICHIQDVTGYPHFNQLYWISRIYRISRISNRIYWISKIRPDIKDSRISRIHGFPRFPKIPDFKDTPDTGFTGFQGLPDSKHSRILRLQGWIQGFRLFWLPRQIYDLLDFKDSRIPRCQGEAAFTGQTFD